MLPTASHTILTLTENVPVSALERGVWTKAMKKTIEAKIKVAKTVNRILTLKKLHRKGLGTDSVEKFAKRECRESKKGRTEVVKKIIKEKVKDAENEEKKVKGEFKRH